MKTIFTFALSTIISGLVWAPLSFAQSVSVDTVNPDTADEGTTTIQITKSKKPVDASTTVESPTEPKPLWEVVDGTSDVQGALSDTHREARENWNKACEKWTKKFSSDNKENKIISVSCGTPTCDGTAGNVTCVSKSQYKIKTRLD